MIDIEYCIIWFVFFFFKQKTAYEMRISDWSSDVCSSDLLSADMPIRKDTEPRLLRYIYTGRRETQLGIEFHMRSGAAFQREGAGSFGRRLRHRGITVFVPQTGDRKRVVEGKRLFRKCGSRWAQNT